MNQIFWENKGHTRQLRLNNLWPTTDTYYTPKEFLKDKGIILLIDPKKLEGKYFMANFYCFDARSALFQEYPERDGRITSCCRIQKYFFHAEYIERSLMITSYRWFRPDKNNRMEDYFNQTRMALHLLEEAITMFDNTFPVQCHQDVIDKNAIPNNT